MTMAPSGSEAEDPRSRQGACGGPWSSAKQGTEQGSAPRKDALTRTQRAKKCQAVGQERDRCPSAITGGTWQDLAQEHSRYPTGHGSQRSLWGKLYPSKCKQ